MGYLCRRSAEHCPSVHSVGKVVQPSCVVITVIPTLAHSLVRVTHTAMAVTDL